MIKQILKKFNLENCRFQNEPVDFSKGFLIRFQLKAPVASRMPETLFSVPGMIAITAQMLTSQEAATGWGWAENYLAYADDQGNVPVLEAAIYLDVPFHPERTEMKIGVPLTLYDAVHQEMVLVYDGMHLWFLHDGVIINENFPYGSLKAATGPMQAGKNLALLSFSSDLDAMKPIQYTRDLNRSIQYYSPSGHSAWAGDVVNFWHEGVYHLYYLYDHHHHQNRWGGGVHYFYHMTTTDFINWVDHGPAFEIEAPWQAFGTGTPFFHNGKFYFSVGLHTGRAIPPELLYGPQMQKFYQENGHTRAISFDEIQAAHQYPSGASLMVSEDGFHFTPCHQIFHWAENPSVYSHPDGVLTMCVGDGLWKSDSPTGEWRLMQRGFPPTGESTPLNYTEECPSFFEKDGYKYIIMGLRGFWRTEKNSDEYADHACLGHDIYDGLVVPMVANCQNRLIIAGWLNGSGFGSVIVHRELFQYENGMLGIRWMPETAPGKEKLLYQSRESFRYHHEIKKSHYYELEIDPGAGGIARIQFGNTCEIRLDAERKEAQIGPIGGGRISPVHERTDPHDPNRFQNTHSMTGDFTLANVDCLVTPYSLRIIEYYDPKLHSTLIDVEIGGCRTMISNRAHAFFNQVTATGENGAKIRSMAVYAYEMDPCR